MLHARVHAPKQLFSFGILGVLAILLAAFACNGGVGWQSDEAEVRALIVRSLELTRAENWRELYKLYSPRFREECPYNDFLALSAAAVGLDLAELGVDEIDVWVEGDTAYATYILTYEGKDIYAVTENDPDIFIRLDGRWYDEVDSHTKCSFW